MIKILCFLGALTGIVMTVQAVIEYFQYNKGNCGRCHHPYELEYCGFTGGRQYQCPKCKRIISVSYNWIDRDRWRD